MKNCFSFENWFFFWFEHIKAPIKKLVRIPDDKNSRLYFVHSESFDDLIVHNFDNDDHLMINECIQLYIDTALN